MKHRIIRLLVSLLIYLYCLIAAAASEDYTLMIFGDSLSASYGIDEDAGWVNLLAIQIADQQLPFQVINGSVSGETTTGGLTRLPSMLDSYSPELVILELGGNDGLRGLPLTQMRQNLTAMIELIEQSGAVVLLAGIQIPPNYGPRYTVPFFELYAELAEEKNLVLVPFLIDGIPQQPELIQSDGIHPIAEAQPMILDNVWPWLEPMLQKIAGPGI